MFPFEKPNARILDIAKALGLSYTTVQKQIIDAVVNGTKNDVAGLINEQRQAKVQRIRKIDSEINKLKRVDCGSFADVAKQIIIELDNEREALLTELETINL